MSVQKQKWVKFSKSAKDISEDVLEQMYENIQKKFDSGNMNPYDDLFRYGNQKLMGYQFFPVSEKFLCKFIVEDDIKYLVGYAKDKESCEKILNDYYSEDDDFLELEVIKNPFTI